jgi:hypothetical protein
MILERIPGQRFSRVLRAWEGRTVALLAGGPSLTPQSFARVREEREADRLRVIAINDAYLLAPWADVHYAADVKWHRWHTAGVDKPALGLTEEDVRTRWAAFMGQKCTIQPGEQYLPDTLHVMRNRDHPRSTNGLSLDPEYLVTGCHGGFQSLNLAILAGAARILLLGYDARSGDRGERHFHGSHPIETDAPQSRYAVFREAFRVAENAITATGVRVINCSLASSIETFPKMALEDALADEVAHAR